MGVMQDNSEVVMFAVDSKYRHEVVTQGMHNELLFIEIDLSLCYTMLL